MEEKIGGREWVTLRFQIRDPVQCHSLSLAYLPANLSRF